MVVNVSRKVKVQENNFQGKQVTLVDSTFLYPNMNQNLENKAKVRQ